MAQESRRKAGSGRGQRGFGKMEGDAINHFIGLWLKDGGFTGFLCTVLALYSAFCSNDLTGI
jgi:hypothetical protein